MSEREDEEFYDVFTIEAKRQQRETEQVSEPIKPATDAEIAEWTDKIKGHGFGAEKPTAEFECRDHSEPTAEEKLVPYLRELARHALCYTTAQLVQGLEQAAARIESDAAKLKALELERDTIQEYADRLGANLTAAEGTLKERDEQIARLKFESCGCLHDDFCEAQEQNRGNGSEASHAKARAIKARHS